MSVEEKKLHVLIVDEGARVIVLINKEMAHELRGAKLHAAKVLFDLSTKPKPLSRAYDNEKRSKTHYPDKDAIATMQEEADEVAQPERLAHVDDVIVPPVPRNVTMPKGITRNVTTREHHPEDARGPLSGNAVRVLRAVAGHDQPVIFRDVRADLPKMAGGTVSSNLFELSEAGYLQKMHNVSRKTMVYTITPLGEDVLTRPERQPALDLRPMEGSA